MINISQLVRKSKQHPLTDRLIEFVEPEFYLAENVADYRANRSIITPPWFKRIPSSAANNYAFIVFYNVGIKAIFEDGELIENYVEVHDNSRTSAICWPGLGDDYPCKKSYPQTLADGELDLKDWVYQLIVRHIYEKELSFVVSVTKNKFSTPRTKKDSLVNKISSLFPELEPQPQY